MSLTDLDSDKLTEFSGKGHLSRAWSRLLRKKIAVVSIAILVIVYFAGIFAPLISPYDYAAQDYTSVRKSPSLSHLAGTDFAGRDVFTRVIWGIQNTVIITVVAMATGGLVLGVGLGLIAGYFGRKIDAVIMRVGELFAAFPDIFLVIIIAATLRPRILDWVRLIEDSTGIDGLVRSGVADYFVVSIALVSFSWVGMARLVRGQVFKIKANQHVEASRAIGASASRILLVHLLPNAISPVVVTVSMGMGALIFTEIVLSWLGLGIQPPRPSLGRMLLEGCSISALKQVPWLLLAPGSVALVLVFCWNLLGDALSDVLNPRTR